MRGRELASENGITWRRADLGDLALLVSMRVAVLRAANGLDQDTDLSAVEEASRGYYLDALPAGRHTAILVFDGETCIGTGDVSYFTVMPTYHNPTGEKAYLMNLYTAPAYRRRGIAGRTLSLLVRDAGERGIGAVSLEATAMGRPLYEAFGFVPMMNEMELGPDAPGTGKEEQRE